MKYRFTLTAKQDLWGGKIKKGSVVCFVSDFAGNPSPQAIQAGWKNIGVDAPFTCCQHMQYSIVREDVR